VTSSLVFRGYSELFSIDARVSLWCWSGCFGHFVLSHVIPFLRAAVCFSKCSNLVSVAVRVLHWHGGACCERLPCGRHCYPRFLYNADVFAVVCCPCVPVAPLSLPNLNLKLHVGVCVCVCVLVVCFVFTCLSCYYQDPTLLFASVLCEIRTSCG
jgi:hypothetical protein